MKTRSATASKSGRRGSMMSARGRGRGMRPAASKSRRGGSKPRNRSRLRARSGARSGRAAKSKARAGGAKRGRSTRSRSRAGRSGRAAQATKNHNEIKQWVQSRGGHPATVRATVKGRDPAGLLRIDFPGFSGGKSLKAISWGEFFEVFDERNLTFLYQKKSASGKPSRFNKMVCKK